MPMHVMRTCVNLELCQGHGLCSWSAPDVFEPDPVDGHSVVKLAEIPSDLQDSVRRAAANCPESAIEIIES
jgi:ferredoxin